MKRTKFSNGVDFKKHMGFKNRTEPIKHPPVENGWVRVELPEVGASTDKAVLFNFKDPALKNGGMIWIPKSCHKIRWGGSGLYPQDDKSALDIQEWFYKKEIEE